MLILAFFSHQRDLKTFEVKEGRALAHRTDTKCEDLSTRRKENGFAFLLFLLTKSTISLLHFSFFKSQSHKLDTF